MIKKLAALTLICIASVSPALSGFASDDLKLIKTPELISLQTSAPANVVVLDANRPATRKEEGLLPGAIPLSSSSEYKASELPPEKDKKLVFYCYNEMCMASHTAAERAKEFGYKNVSVLSDGVVGWKKAGGKTDSYEG